MTIADHCPAPASDTIRELLAEAAADYKAAQRKRQGLDHRDDAGVRARAARAAGDHYDNARVTH